MEIQILNLLDGAKKAKGLTIIIDVFRAFSVACYIFNKGANKIIPVADLDKAYELKRKHPEYVLVGERKGKILKGFDYGNSPSELLKADLMDKIVVHTTSAGTQGIIHAVHADEIITGSFVNAEAIVNYIKNKNPKVVSLVAMGNFAEYDAEEDLLFAHYIKNALIGDVNDMNKIVTKLKAGAGKKFFDPLRNWYPQDDFNMCLDVNKFNFVLKVSGQEEGEMFLEKIDK